MNWFGSDGKLRQQSWHHSVEKCRLLLSVCKRRYTTNGRWHRWRQHGPWRTSLPIAPPATALALWLRLALPWLLFCSLTALGKQLEVCWLRGRSLSNPCRCRRAWYAASAARGVVRVGCWFDISPELTVAVHSVHGVFFRFVCSSISGSSRQVAVNFSLFWDTGILWKSRCWYAFVAETWGNIIAVRNIAWSRWCMQLRTVVWEW